MREDRLVELSFARVDVSHTGRVSAEDVVNAARKLNLKHRLSVQDVKSWIAQHDTTNDGELSLQEFTIMMTSI